MIHKLFPCNCWIFYQRLSTVYPHFRLCSSLIGLLLLASPVGLASLGVRLLLARPRFPIFGVRPTSPFVPTCAQQCQPTHVQRLAKRMSNVKCLFWRDIFFCPVQCFFTICGHGCQAFYAKTARSTTGGSASYALSR